VYALVVSADNEKEEVTAVGKKFRIDVARFVVGLLGFRDCQRLLAPCVGGWYPVQDALDARREDDYAVAVPTGALAWR
jgi:hypothetical protein